jgi:extradiol dioxygenase family protein
MNISAIKLGDIMVGGWLDVDIHVYISTDATSRIAIKASSIVVRQYGCTYAHALWTHLSERAER